MFLKGYSLDTSLTLLNSKLSILQKQEKQNCFFLLDSIIINKHSQFNNFSFNLPSYQRKKKRKQNLHTTSLLGQAQIAFTLKLSLATENS